jgi:butyryl-CoA dehydrogenase
VNADIASIFAVTARYGEDDAQTCLRLVDAPDRKGIAFSGNRKIFGLSSAHISDIKFDGYDLGKESLLCDDTNADEAIDFAFCIAKCMLAAGCVGMVEAAIAISAEHAREREQFGQKISQFQAIQWKLADMSAEGSAARLLTYRAAWSKEGKPEDFKRAAAMSKLFAAKVARVHSAEAVQIMGSFGILEDSAVERFYRDAKVMEVLGGTAEAQKLELIKELGV